MNLHTPSFKAIFLTITCSLTSMCFAHSNTAIILKERLSHVTPDKIMCTKHVNCKNAAQLALFYRQHNYLPIWVKHGKLTVASIEMLHILNHSYQDGLDPRNYHIKQLNWLIAQLNVASGNSYESTNIESASSDIQPTESLTPNIAASQIASSAPVASITLSNQVTLLADFELTLSDAFLLYAHDLYYGQIDVKKVYPNWDNIKPDINLLAALDLAAVDPKTVVHNLTPQYPMYSKLKAKLHDYEEVATNGGWTHIPNGESLERGDSGKRVKLLRQRLAISGELSNIGGNKFDAELERAVMQYQDNNGLYDDGVVDSDTLNALNVPIKTRIQQIELNMDKLRLLPPTMPSDYIMVNIPTYGLQTVSAKQAPLSIEVAVGGTEHPSCVLNSKIAYLVLNPYWDIPADIAESEIWPSIKKDPKFIKTRHVQILKKDKHGVYRQIDPSKIDWYHITPRQLHTYRFRQAPGTNNALGKVKFIFPNRCGIYLHGSNESELFQVYERAFSHGCIRLSQPLNMTTYVLTNEKNLSVHKINQMFESSVDTVVTMPQPLPIYIMYLTAIVNDDDWLQFGVDIYHLDNLHKYSVFLPEN